jgi:hypothetical protein
LCQGCCISVAFCDEVAGQHIGVVPNHCFNN